MKVKEIMNRLFEWTPSERACGSDRLIYGDDNKDVKKAAVCCIATYDVIKKAAEWGADFIISHERTFHTPANQTEAFDIDIRKREILEHAGITVYQFHDHAHFTDSDKIIEGVLKKLGWKGAFDGHKQFLLDVTKSVDEIITDIEKNLELKNIRIVGDKNNIVKNVAMPVGAWLPEEIISLINKPEVDMVITGEITEYSVCEYVRDVAASGEKKTLLLLGHMGSEKSGMEYICNYLSDTIDDVEFKYIDCGEVY